MESKMQNVFELAMKLGKLLREDPRLVRMEQARVLCETDEEYNRLLTEYDVQQKALAKVYESGDAVEVAEGETPISDLIQARINALYQSITQHPAYVELTAAQADVNELMNLINNTITFAITGEMPASCTHDCSSCGGGCHT